MQAVAKHANWENAPVGLIDRSVDVGNGVVRYRMQTLESGESIVNAWITSVKGAQ